MSGTPSNVETIILSGVSPGHTGVGRLVNYLQQHEEPSVKIHWALYKMRSLQRTLQQGHYLLFLREVSLRLIGRAKWAFRRFSSEFRRSQRLILIHPQTLGASWVLNLIEQRSSTDIFVMDASFFCRSSYNNRNGQECLECLGTEGEPAVTYGCRRYPVNRRQVSLLVRELPRLAAAGKVRFLVQSHGYARLVRSHCGANSAVAVVGLWSGDWDFEPPQCDLPNGPWDVVFHGSDDLAKGSRWALEVARHTPVLRFLFPFARPVGFADVANIAFIPCSWETGLGTAVTEASIIMHPSRWSAPIEGALIKSIRWGNAVAITRSSHSYSADLPEGLTLNLSDDVREASSTLVEAIANQWSPDDALRTQWWSDLRREPDLLARLRTPTWL
jgi:hypothetical protein